MRSDDLISWLLPSWKKQQIGSAPQKATAVVRIPSLTGITILSGFQYGPLPFAPLGPVVVTDPYSC